jgi:hypothetical protein
MIVSLVVIVLVSRGYLTMRTVIVIVAGSSPLIIVPISLVIFR